MTKRLKTSRISRRALLGGMAASLPVAYAHAAQPTRPLLRPAGIRAQFSGQVEQIFGRSGLANHTGFVLTDLSSGQVIEQHNGAMPQPPASVAKVMTALYGLEGLGGGYRFRTRVVVTGPVKDGVVEGDLVLVGSGDPTLDTDRLADMARAVAEAGIKKVRGRFVVASGALPFHHAIEATQPEFVGYNPAISGSNLNFNRVHFQWTRDSGGYALAMTARAARHDTPVAGVGMQVVDRQAPVFTYEGRQGRDNWTVSQQALGRTGSRWLPVRAPGQYTGEVFRTLAYANGVSLPPFEETDAQILGREIAVDESEPAREIIRGMLKYSNNLTAETIGLRASQQVGMAPATIEQSSAAMTRWLAETHGIANADICNHSGLTDRSHISALEMVRVLNGAQTGSLPALLRDRPLVSDGGEKVVLPGIGVVAKTGTMNFVRGLSGYIVHGSGRRYGFAIFAADKEARAELSDKDTETPRGAAGWMGRAKEQERALLWSWASALS